MDNLVSLTPRLSPNRACLFREPPRPNAVREVKPIRASKIPTIHRGFSNENKHLFEIQSQLDGPPDHTCTVYPRFPAPERRMAGSFIETASSPTVCLPRGEKEIPPFSIVCPERKNEPTKRIESEDRRGKTGRGGLEIWRFIFNVIISVTGQLSLSKVD